jgi:hypothetical protein
VNNPGPELLGLRVRHAENSHPNFDDNDAAGNDSLPIQLQAQKTTIIWTRQPGPKWSERRLLVPPPETKISSSLLAR